MVELNNRQKKLYQFLLDKSDSNRFISKDEICTTLSKFYPRNEENSTVNNSTAFRQLRKDIREINRSDVEKIVIYDMTDGGYKIADEKEAIEFIDSRFRKDLRSLKINWNLRRKVGNNNQLQAKNENLLEFVKTFVERGTLNEKNERKNE